MPMVDPQIMCPHTGFARSCNSIVSEHTCPKFTKILGKHPQTGADIEHVGCSDTMLPLLLLEISQQVRQSGAATESFRNEFARRVAAPTLVHYNSHLPALEN